MNQPCNKLMSVQEDMLTTTTWRMKGLFFTEKYLGVAASVVKEHTKLRSSYAHIKVNSSHIHINGVCAFVHWHSNRERWWLWCYL